MHLSCWCLITMSLGAAAAGETSCLNGVIIPIWNLDVFCFLFKRNCYMIWLLGNSRNIRLLPLRIWAEIAVPYLPVSSFQISETACLIQQELDFLNVFIVFDSESSWAHILRIALNAWEAIVKIKAWPVLRRLFREEEISWIYFFFLFCKMHKLLTFPTFNAFI